MGYLKTEKKAPAVYGWPKNGKKRPQQYMGDLKVDQIKFWKSLNPISVLLALEYVEWLIPYHNKAKRKEYSNPLLQKGP